MNLNSIWTRFKNPILIIAGLFIISRLWMSCTKKDDSLQIIRTAKVTKGDMVVKVESTASVKPYNRVEIKPPIAGRVDKISVQEGDTVKPGQVLAWMSSTERAALIDAARSQGEESLQHWENAYKPAPLVSPLEGTVIVRAVEPGQTVATTEPVVVIADRLMIQALVDETDLAQIKLGQNTQILLDAYRGRTLKGKVDHISYESTLTNNINMYTVDILPENAPDFFRSGMTANVAFIVADKTDTLLIPSEAVTEWPRGVPKPEGAEFAVYKKAFGGKTTPVPVVIGESDGRMTEVESGLKEGMEIVIVKKKEKNTSGAFSGQPQRRPQGGRPA